MSKRKYEHPVPDREFILRHLKKRGSPATFNELFNDLLLTTPPEKEGLDRRLKAMLRDGQLILNRRAQYCLPDKLSVVTGYVQAHRDGFGWLIQDGGRGPDVFLSARQMQKVFTDDRVMVRITSVSARRPEGVIVEVLERNTEYVAGRFYEEKGIAFVEPDSKSITHQIIVPHGSAKSGQYVVVKITAQPNERRQPTGEVSEILGDQLTPGLEVELAVRAHNLPYQFSADVLSETKALPDRVTEKELAGRRDLRDFPFVTIDGEDAKDFDDAICCEQLENGHWRAMIAIADVSHYVTPDSELDKTAQTRGNSVYFPTRVIPMLPEKLSNELCSLRPNCDRLVMVCDVEIDSDGIVKKYQIDNGVIHSKARLTYTEVAAALSGESKKIPEKLRKKLEEAHDVFKILFRLRQFRGAIEFETTETQILFDQNGKIDRIVPRTRNVAHRIIEELMLLANETVSRHLDKMHIPVLYRVHDLPEEDRLSGLRDFLKSFSLRLSGGDTPKPIDYAKLLERVAKRKDAQLIQTVMLRSLRQAIYSPDNRGHFGLSYESYCHFTSPIRRYPDLYIHRALKHGLQRKKKFGYSKEAVEKIGEHCSMTERRADRAARDATDWLKCDYLQDHVGKTFEGVIMDVTSFGFFVELKDIYVQGLVHVTALKNDYYVHDPIRHCLRGRAGNQEYRLGDSVRVLVARVDLDKRQIDFAIQ